MKKFLLFCVALLSFSLASAQQTKYHGEVYVAGGYGIGSVPMHRVQLHTIHGARIGEVVSLGIGLGADIHTPDFDSGFLMIPLFADLKLYAPTRGNFDPFVMFDIGYALEVEDQIGGMMLNAGLGFKAGVFALSLGYNLQQLSLDGISINMNALQLKLGVAF
jgi:hypothetical protein